MWDSLVVRESDADNPETFPTAMGTLTRLAYERAKREGVQIAETLLEDLHARAATGRAS